MVFIIALTFFLKPILPVLDYIINYQYISNVLCENKDKPELKCCGKCHLKKELAKASEGEKPINSDKKDNAKQEVEVLFFQEIKKFAFLPEFGCNKSIILSIQSDIYNYLNGTSIFHPPIFIS